MRLAGILNTALAPPSTCPRSSSTKIRRTPQIRTSDVAYEDLYDFYGYPLTVRSNTQQSLDHIRSLYRRFLVRQGIAEETPSGGRDADNLIEVQDHLEDSGEITVSFCRCSTHLSHVRDGHYACESISDKMHKKFVYPSLFSFYQGVMISAIGYNIQKSHVFIHAGAVSWNGQGLIFPSLPNRGKSTLSVYLSRRGFKFLSDEIACFDLVRGRLEAHPRSVRLRNSSHALLNLKLDGNVVEDRATGKCIVDIEDLVGVGGVVGEACPLHMIFFLEGFSEKPLLRPMEKFVAARQLLSYCFNPMEDGALSFAWIAPMVREARCYGLTMGSLEETADMLMKECGKGSADGA